jgi:2-polyprenyl-6-methoxyphenol hydroxylase-like FAD-dependent oxidoreductase
MTEDQRRILIAGGGPVGLLCAWLIGRHGLPVRLFANNSALQMDLRAATTHPATLDLLDDELVSDMARVGLVARSFSSGTGRAGSSSRSSIRRPRMPWAYRCADPRGRPRNTAALI